MNPKKTALIVILSIALTLDASAGARAGFVTNGSFEADTLTAGTKEYFSTSGVSNVSGWSGGTGLTFLDSPGSADNGTYLSVYKTFPTTSPDGGNFVEGDSAPSYRGVIYQTISGLTAGQGYEVSFYQAAGQQTGFTGPTTEQWLVGLGTTLALSQSSAKASSMFSIPQGGVGPWQAQTLYFTATASSEVLSFLANGTPNGEPPIAFLDGVSMTVVPEPSTLLLMGMGMLGLGGVHLRRRAKAAVA